MKNFFDYKIRKIFNLIDNVLDWFKKSDGHSVEEVVSKPSNKHISSDLLDKSLLIL